MKKLYAVKRSAVVVAILALSLSGAGRKHQFTPHERAYYSDPATAAFTRPGLVLEITGAQIASDGTITATVSITDPTGVPLDMTGAATPGAVSISLIAATIPKGQEQYVAYTTRVQKSPITNVSATQASTDSGGTFTPVTDGVYQYKFATRAPTGYDATATHTIGAYASRDLTASNLGTDYASTTFSFVPNGAKVTVTRDVVHTTGCDSCHDQLSYHGGSRRGVELCILCHTPQTIDPDTGNTVDFKVMVHKIHMGSSLPSVQAGTPYQIIGYNQAVADWSTVVDPADVRRCETCHQQNVNAAQAKAYLLEPARAACGACHDDINFATGKNHPGGPQPDDTLCAICHIPQGELEFDASIKGAHTIATDSASLSGLVVNITKIQNSAAGGKPAVSFTLQDASGKPLLASALGSLSFTMAGPTSDYGYTSFGSDVTTPGYVTESATGASCGSNGSCTYTFQHAVPAKATGTYSIGVEARRTETILAGTSTQQSVTYGARNQVVSFSVDGSPLVPRRTVVATANCNQCHVELSVHGVLRNQTEYCGLCHNPSNTDGAARATATVAADKAAPPQGINFNLMVHRIHTGVNLVADNRTYIIVGYGGSHNDFTGVRYPAMSATGTTGDTRNCSLCHVNSSEQNLPIGKNPVVDPQGPINPIPPVSSACTGCHADLAAAEHTMENTTVLGESCTVCHSASAPYSVSKVHAQY